MRRFRKLTTFALAALCVSIPTFAQTKPASQQVLEAGRNAVRQENYGEAIRLLEDGLRQFPKDRRLKLELGRAYLYNREDNRATAVFQEILREEPSNRLAKLELARALGYRRDYGTSTQLYRQLLKANPDDEAASVGLIRNLMHQKQTAEARRELKLALARHPGSQRLQEYQRRLDQTSGKSRDRLRQRREPPPAAMKKRGQLRGTGAYFSDSSGNRSWRSTQRFEQGIARSFALRSRAEERSLWKSSGPRANVMWATEELRLRLSPAVLVSGSGGAVRFADGKSRALFGGTVELHPARRMWVTGEFLRRPVSPTFRSTQFDLLTDDWRATLKWYPRAWRMKGAWSHGNYSDGNSGERLSAEALSWIGPSHLGFAAGYRFNYIGFRQSPLHGYFSPNKYYSHLGLSGVRLGVGRSFRGEYLAGLGVESIATGPYRPAWELAMRNRILLGNWEVRGDYFYFRLAQDTGAFRSHAVRLTGTYYF